MISGYLMEAPWSFKFEGDDLRKFYYPSWDYCFGVDYASEILSEIGLLIGGRVPD